MTNRRRIFLLEEDSPEKEKREKQLRADRYDLVTADSQNIYWTKLLEAGPWHAVIFHWSCADLILVEFGSEYTTAVIDEGTRLVIISDEPVEPVHLPTALRRAVQVTGDEELAAALR